MKPMEITVESAKTRMTEILNSFLTINQNNLQQLQLEYQYLRGFTVGYESRESEEKEGKRPDLKAVGKSAN